jgi:hypothetical protein
LRRAVSSFTVEVRRRPRLAITSNPHVQSSETKSPQAGFDREPHRVAAAAFEARKVDPSPVDVESSPGGRILPSLVPEESLRRTLRDAAPTAAESDPPSRTPKRRDQASKSPRNSGFSSAANAPLADGLSPKSRQPSNVQSDEGAAFRQGSRRPSKVKSSETPAVWRWAQRQDEETRSRSLATTSGSGVCPASSDPRQGRTHRPRFLRESTIVHRKVESEPSWLATSSAMNSNPASVGSGDCSPRAEAPGRTLLLGADPRSVKARVVAIPRRPCWPVPRRKNALMV